MSKKGIDISQHNGNIDFGKVKDDGIEFIILRLGWIGNKNNHTMDKKFVEYYNKCRLYNIPVGIYVYSYCTSIETAKQGAEWTIKKLKENGINHLDYPVFIDMEDDSTIKCGQVMLTYQAVEFCKTIETSGYKAGVYANLNWFKNYLQPSKLITYKIWLAQYTNNSNHSANFQVDMWQYTSSGSVSGITTKVDLNKCLVCEEDNSHNIPENGNGGYEVKLYQNGSTKEIVYQDTSCQTQIGYLNPREQAECYGIINNLALIVYNVDKKGYKKTGFVKWLGGVK